MKALRFVSWARPDGDRPARASSRAADVVAASPPTPSHRMVVEPVLRRSTRAVPRGEDPWRTA